MVYFSMFEASLQTIVVFLLGLVVGSFLNAVIYRLERGESALKGRSYCPRCKHQLAWHDLVPVVSFILLRGKCGYCRGGISWQYPAVEISTGALFLLVFWHLDFGIDLAFGIWSLPLLNLLYLWIVASLLVVLFVYDLRHYILPDKVLFPAIGLAFCYRVFEFLNLNNWDLGFGISAPFVQSLFSAFAAGLFFFAIFFLSRGAAMGFGDVKLAAFMGLFLGWPNIIVALFIAFMVGAVVGVVLILLKKKGMKSEVPFGPFLIAGTFAALFWREAFVDWYLTFFLI